MTQKNEIQLDSNDWECVNCGDEYCSSEYPPDEPCGWCGELAGWKRLHKAECPECGMIHPDADPDKAREQARNCEHDAPWYNGN